MKYKLQLITLLMSILLIIISIGMMAVDGVVIILSYVSLFFALVSISQRNRKGLKIFAFLFIIAHIAFFFRTYLDTSSKSNTNTMITVPSETFVRCSNMMFSHKNDLTQQLTNSDKKKMNECVKINE